MGIAMRRGFGYIQHKWGRRDNPAAGSGMFLMDKVTGASFHSL